MSLKVWLPLDGDLRNLGATPITVENHGATVNDNGIIGKCYYFNGSAQFLQLSDSLPDLYCGDFTWALWVKPTDSTRSILISEYASSGSSNVALELLANRSVRVYWNASPDWNNSPIIPIDTWTHIAFTRQERVFTLYINGIKYITQTVSGAADRTSSSKIRFGDDYRGGTSVSYQGYMNDVRIYNNALSAAEIYELSRGLNRHYKFSDFSMNLINKDTLTSGYYITSSGALTSNAYWYVTDYIHIYPGRTYQTYDLSHGGSGTYIELYKADKTATRRIQMVANTNNTILAASDEYYIKLSIRNVAGELELACLREVPSVLRDSTGYGHSGTIVGTITYDESAKQSSAIYMNNTSTANHIEADALPAETKTISFWVKCTLTKNQVIFADTTSVIEFGLLNQHGYVNFTSNSGFDLDNFVTDEWNHVVVQKNGTAYSLYVNGIACTRTGASNWFNHNKNTLYFFNRGNNNSYGAEASISDFRAYSTLLTETDILALYQTGAKIDDESGLLTDEIVEDNGRELIAGAFITTPFNNNTDAYTAYQDGEIHFTNTSLVSVGCPYIHITPANHNFYWQCEVSKNAGNYFYIGFERYDANKTARSNNACVYVVADRDAAWDHRFFSGTVNLATDSVNPCDSIRLRILNGWSGTVSGADKTSTIHRLSLREVPAATPQKPSVGKNAVVTAGSFDENTKAAFYKNGFVEADHIVEI